MAEVVAQVLLQSQTDVLIEVAADPDSPPSSVEQAVAQVLPFPSCTTNDTAGLQRHTVAQVLHLHCGMLFSHMSTMATRSNVEQSVEQAVAQVCT